MDRRLRLVLRVSLSVSGRSDLDEFLLDGLVLGGLLLDLLDLVLNLLLLWLDILHLLLDLLLPVVVIITA